MSGRAPPRGPPPRGAPPRGAPPRGPPNGGGRGRGGPPRGARPPPGGRGPPGRGPPNTTMPPRGSPPGGRGQGPPPRGQPPGVARGVPPRGSPPRGMPRGAPGRGPPRGAPSQMPRGPQPTGVPPKGPPPRAPPKKPGPPVGPANLNKGPPVPPGQPKFGKLHVKCVKGMDLKAGKGLMGKANPYSKLRIGSQEFYTTPHVQGGQNPVWNEDFVFQISTETELEIEILDKQDVGNDKFMACNKVNIADWIAQGSFQGNIDMLDKQDKPVGGVFLEVKFDRPNAEKAAQQQQQKQQEAQQKAMGINPNGNGKPNPSEPTRDPHGKFTDQEILDAFTAFDLDNNNFVGAAELRHILINIGEQVTDDEVDEMIKMVDKDGDGQVCFEEFYEMVTTKKPPDGLGNTGRPGAAGRTVAPPPPTGQSVIQSRNAKKTALDEFAKDNSIKPETIKKSYKRFQTTDKDKSGMIDYTEFCEILQVDPSPVSEKAFQLFDYDKSGQIEVREFLIALTNFTGASKDEKLKFSFAVFDEDSNGVITKDELTKILKANHMASADVEVARKAETIMAQADKDNDGVITFDEFVIVSKKFPNILFPAYSK